MMMEMKRRKMPQVQQQQPQAQPMQAEQQQPQAQPMQAEPMPQVMRPDWQATPENPGKMSDFGQMTEPNPDKWAARIPVDMGLAAVSGGGLSLASKIPQVMKYAPTLAKMLGYTGTALSGGANTLRQAALGGGAEGAITEAVQPDATLGSIAGQAGLGAATGGVGQKVFGRATSPLLKTDPRAQRLLDEGAELTTGSRIGRGAKNLEDKFTSWPLAGGSIVGAKNRERDSLNTLLVNDALAPLQGPRSATGKDMIPWPASPEAHMLPDDMPAGHEAILFADTEISKRYEDVLDKMSIVRDPEFAGEIKQLKGMAESLPKKERDAFNQIIDSALDTNISGGSDVLLGQTYKTVFKRLRDDAARFQKSPDGFQQNLGNALHESAMSLKRMGQRQNPEQAKRLEDVDRAFAKMATVRDAAEKQGAEDGVFSANQYLSSVRKNATGKNYSQGKAFNQGLAEDARAVMSQKIPDSGTAGRLLTGGLVGGGAGATGTIIPTLLGLGAGGAAYTKQGQKIVNSLLFDAPKPLQEGLRKSANPYLGLLSAATATEKMRELRRLEEEEQY